MLTLIREAKQGELVGSALKEASKAHAQLFSAAYPTEAVKAKNHWAHHLGPQVMRDGLLLDCFVGERKNGTIKRQAADLKNTSAFERSLLMRVAAAQLNAMTSDSFLCDQLLSPEKSAILAQRYQVPSASISNSMQWDGIRLRKGDHVFLDGMLHVVQCFALVGSNFAVVGYACQRLAQALVQVTLGSGARFIYSPDQQIIRRMFRSASALLVRARCFWWAFPQSPCLWHTLACTFR